ncbi:MAG: thioredoxin family protein [Flavobacteriaceae bacterium]|nr:thioredoxin family protein [Flavobacteriaceae bacterium]
MNKYFFLLLISSFIDGQPIDPVQWTSDYKKNQDGIYTIRFDAQIEDGWHLYSQFSDENGALPTEFIFLDSQNRYGPGRVKESPSVVAYDQVFEMDLTFFRKEASFEVDIELIDPDIEFFEIEINYQVCDDKLCIFRSEVFEFVLDTNFVKPGISLDAHSLEKSQEMYLDLGNRHYLDNETPESQTSHWTIFFLGLLGGFLALLTPCVLPMIPLTISYFLNSSQGSSNGTFNGLLYGFFIILVYLLLSLPFHLFDTLNPEALNSLATSVVLNLVFFGVFIVFALSFFGLFNLTLPRQWIRRTDKLSSMGNVVGIFFMALTLAIVSFSCTGPLLGSLLAGSITSETGAIQLTYGMLGFGLALGLPFAFFAIFPGAIKWLPSSGGWMTSIKVTLGFLELALALKFLSNADLVAHWGILKREVFIAIWLFIAIGLMLYLFGIFQSRGFRFKKLSAGRLIFGFIALLFCGYLLNDFFSKQNTLRFLSGFPPPEFYSINKVENQCPLNLPCFKDYQQGLQFAKAEQRPILLDFTGWACINCRKMEENVWAHPDVFTLLQKYVIISLYVDDRKKLPLLDQFNFQYQNGNIRKINAIGKKWSAFQYVNFGTASQPFYIQLSPDQELLNTPIQYVNRPTFQSWLERGFEEYQKQDSPYQSPFLVQ